MAPLILNPSVQRRHTKRAKRPRPVGNGESGIVARHQRAGHNQNKRSANDEDGKEVQSATIRNFDAFQNSPRENRAIRASHGEFRETD